MNRLPDDILYVIFEAVESASPLPRIRSYRSLEEVNVLGHPLLPSLSVCKLWKSVVERLIYVNIGLITTRGVNLLVDHLERSEKGRCLARSTTKTMTICGPVEEWMLWGIPDMIRRFLHARKQILLLFTLLPALRRIELDAPLYLTSQNVVDIIRRSAPVPTDLSMRINATGISLTDMKALEMLSRLRRLAVKLDSSYKDLHQASHDRSSDDVTICIPLLKVLSIQSDEWGAEHEMLLDSLELPSITDVDLQFPEVRHSAAQIQPALERFFQRHAETITTLTLIWPNSAGLNALLHCFKRLKWFTLLGNDLEEGTLSALPASLERLSHGLYNHELELAEYAIGPDKFFHNLTAQTRLPSLRCIGPCPNLDWATFQAVAGSRTDRRMKVILNGLKGKGIDLLDREGRTYTEGRDRARRPVHTQPADD